jgi:hypothetical protein
MHSLVLDVLGLVEAVEDRRRRRGCRPGMACRKPRTGRQGRLSMAVRDGSHSTGLAYRRCQLAKVNGEELEVTFLRQKNKTKRTKETSNS